MAAEATVIAIVLSMETVPAEHNIPATRMVPLRERTGSRARAGYNAANEETMADLNEDQQMIVDTARAYAQEKLRPNAARWEEEGLDRDVLKELAGLGFAGIYVREDVGGSALSRHDATLIFEELFRAAAFRRRRS